MIVFPPSFLSSSLSSLLPPAILLMLPLSSSSLSSFVSHRRREAATVKDWTNHLQELRDDAKNRRFFHGSAQRRKHNTHPADARVDIGRVGRGRGKWGGVLLAQVLIVSSRGDASRWILYHGVVQFLSVWHNFYRGDTETRNSGFTVARRNVAPVRLWSQNCKNDVRMTRIQCQGGRFWRNGYRQKSAGGEKRFGEKTRGTFFRFIQ